MLRTWKNPKEEKDACARPRMYSGTYSSATSLSLLIPLLQASCIWKWKFSNFLCFWLCELCFLFVCVMGCSTQNWYATKEPTGSTHHVGPQIPSCPLSVSPPLGCGGLLRQQRGIHYHGCWNMSDSQWSRKSLVKPAWAVTTSHRVTPYLHVAITGLMEGSLDAHGSRAWSSGHVHRASPWLAMGRCQGRAFFSSELWVATKVVRTTWGGFAHTLKPARAMDERRCWRKGVSLA